MMGGTGGMGGKVDGDGSRNMGRVMMKQRINIEQMMMEQMMQHDEMVEQPPAK